MAGRGPAPKAPELRRNRNPKVAGEWIDLPPLTAAVLPELPQDEWSERTLRAWRAWRRDPATTQYGDADIQLAIDLAYVYEDWVRRPSASTAGEIRQRQDSLGLSPKGRQDRRWRIAAGEVVELESKPSASERMRELRERAASAGRASS